MTSETVAAVLDQLYRMPGAIMARIVRGLAATPSQMGRHRRAAVIVAVDDPWLDHAALDRVIAEVGIGPAQVHRLPTGGHHPHVESAQYPERSARNLVDIVRVIDAMLVTASQPSLDAVSPSMAGPTLPAGTSTDGF
jgi:hypothetical protein